MTKRKNDKKKRKKIKEKRKKEKKEKKKKKKKREKNKERNKERKILIRSGDSIKQHPWKLPVATGSVHLCCSPKWLLKVSHQSPLLPVATARNWVGFHGPQIESKNTSIFHRSFKRPRIFLYSLSSAQQYASFFQSRARDFTTRSVGPSVRL